MLRFARFMMMGILAMFIGTAHAADAPEFTVTTTPDTTVFKFTISAAGNFTIDWGDGQTQSFNKTNTKKTTYSHTYGTAGAYKIGISGDATAYDKTSNPYTSISFGADYPDYLSGSQIATIDGSLGAIFGTLSDGTGPKFDRTFMGCTSLTSIPGDLFAGITTGASEMFSSTFRDCTSLTSIPGDLFAGITTGGSLMFSSTFSRCTSLTSIPNGLFAGRAGAGAMFASTFYRCTSLTSIPGDLFAGITSGAEYMFNYTFAGCTSLTSIPDDLFSDIKTGLYMVFLNTFDGCSGLTGYVNGNMFTVPSDGDKKLYYNTFAGADNMMKTCPENTYAVPKPDPNWTVAVCLPCPDGTTSPADSQSIDACVIERCDISIMSSTGVVIPTYPNPRTRPSIAIQYGDSACYVDVETDTESNKYYIHAE